MTEISLSAPAIFHIVGIPISNGHLTAFVVTIFLLIFGLFARKKMGIIPSRFQSILEMGIEYISEQLEEAFGSKKRARKFLPMIMTTMIFIMIANEMSIVPIMFQLVHGDAPLFRLPTADLSLTFGLALFMIVLAHILALSMAPLKHIGNFIKIQPFLQVKSVGDFGNALLEFFLGLMDIISELAKVLSLSFRLFGNIFAGEVMVAVIAGLSAYTMFFVPIPFIILSLFSGLIQALVFVLLTIEYIASTVRNYYEEEAV
jgi:F-type H+-transporting ATPase subunit a